MGLLTVRMLAEQGIDVGLFERGYQGHEASMASGGIISPLYPWRASAPITQLANVSQRVYPELCRALWAETGIDVGWKQSGLLILQIEDRDEALTWSAVNQIEVNLLNQTQCSDLQPGLPMLQGDALWYPQLAQVSMPALLQALRKSLSTKENVYFLDQGVQQLAWSEGSVQGVIAQQQAFRAPCVVIAAGAWAQDLLSPLGIELGIKPVRGQMLLLNAEDVNLQCIVLSQGKYILPYSQGRILVGSTVEQVGFDGGTTEEARTALIEAAAHMLPKLAKVNIEKQWAGLRPGCARGLPYIGAVPGVDGLYLNTGHFRNGVVLAPASCQLLTDLIVGHTPCLDPAPYQISS